MRDKHLRIWLGVATQEERPDPGNWEKVVTTIHAAFRGGELTAQCAWKVVVITPKGGGTDFRGIVLVEIMWKAYPASSIVGYFFPSSSITLYIDFARGGEQGTPPLRQS